MFLYDIFCYVLKVDESEIRNVTRFRFLLANLDLLNYCQTEHETKTKIREEQAEGRRLRLEEKRLMAEKLANPAPPTSQADQKKAKGQSGQYGRSKKSEPEQEAEPEPLPYLPTPDELILMDEGEVNT